MSAHWFKLVNNFFNDEKIQLIRRMPSGNEIILCWIALLCLASKSKRPGVIIINDTVVQSEDVLSLEAKVSVEVAKLALGTFSKFGMIGVDSETGSLEVKRFAEHQDLDRLEYYREKERVRKANYRAKTMVLQLENNVPELSHGTGGTVRVESAHKMRGDESRGDESRLHEKENSNKTKTRKQPIHIQLVIDSYSSANGNSPTVTKGHAISLGKLWAEYGEEKYTKTVKSWSMQKQKDGTPHPIGFLCHDPDQYFQKSKRQDTITSSPAHLGESTVERGW